MSTTLLHRNSDPGNRPRSEKFYRFIQRKKDERYQLRRSTEKGNEAIAQKSRANEESPPFIIPREDADVVGNYRKFHKALQQKKNERNARLKNCQKGIDLIRQGDSCTVTTTSTLHSFEGSDDPSISVDSFDELDSDYHFSSEETNAGYRSSSFFGSGDVDENFDEETTLKERGSYQQNVNKARQGRKSKRVLLKKRIQIEEKKHVAVVENKSASPAPKNESKVEEESDENDIIKDLVFSKEKIRRRQGEIREKLAKKLTRLRSLEHKRKVSTQHIQKQIAMIEKASSENTCGLSEVSPSDDEVEVSIISPSSTVSSLSPWKY